MTNNKDSIVLKKVSICDTVSSGEHVFYIGDVTVSESTDEIMKMLFDFITHKKSIFKGNKLVISVSNLVKTERTCIAKYFFIDLKKSLYYNVCEIIKVIKIIKGEKEWKY